MSVRSDEQSPNHGGRTPRPRRSGCRGETRRTDVWPVACAQCLRCELQLSFLTTASVISRTSRLWDGIRGLTEETCTFSTRIVGYDAPRSGGTRPP